MTKSKSPHVLVIDPAVKTPELETYNRLVLTSPVPLSYHLPALFGFSSIHQTDNTPILGIVILGSLSSVNEGLPWQKELATFIQRHFEKKTPLLGLCFGHQLIAHTFGGKVEYVFPDQKKHLGFRQVHLKENPLWGSALSGDLYVSHNEHVVVAPTDFEITATSESIAIDGMAHKTHPVWTFQPHPEAGPKFQQMREGRAPDPSRFSFGQELVARFLSFCQKKHS